MFFNCHRKRSFLDFNCVVNLLHILFFPTKKDSLSTAFSLFYQYNNWRILFR
nr:MAG TPA: hypothetical protein [Siphoviridae sp. ctewe10]